MPEMKIPGPDHPITVAANPKRIQVRYSGHVIADTKMALTLQESSYKPVIYFPREDVEMAFLTRTDHATYCPYKGDASYYTILMDGRFAENAVWTYEDPYPAMESIRGRLAFYPNQVEIYETGDADHPDPARAAAPTGREADLVREAILHTDDGAGASQREHWTPTVGEPQS
jgi:uncharacterized protein (DUF427 family)